MIVNGDFESSAYSVSPWVVTPSLFNIVQIVLTPLPFTFGYGTYGLDLNKDYYPISINQTVTTTVGSTYLLTFVLTGSNNDINANDRTYTKSGIVSATGAQVQTFSIAADPITAEYGVVTVQYYFVATQAKTVISIGSTTPRSNGPIIDNIKLSPVVC